MNEEAKPVSATRLVLLQVMTPLVPISRGTCYFTMVAVDAEGRPTPVPRLLLETEEERQRNQDAASRVAVRRKRKKKLRPIDIPENKVY